MKTHYDVLYFLAGFEKYLESAGTERPIPKTVNYSNNYQRRPVLLARGEAALQSTGPNPEEDLFKE